MAAGQDSQHPQRCHEFLSDLATYGTSARSPREGAQRGGGLQDVPSAE